MNPADLLRNDSLPLESTPPLSSKALPGSATTSKSVKIALSTPRVDTEPIYTHLRAALGESFAEYKSALGAFFLGKLNRNELDRIVSTFLSLAPSVSVPQPSSVPGLTSFSSSHTTLVSTTHLHNALLSALLANIYYRDPPPEAIAPWVLATDAPTHGAGAKASSGAAGAGDKVEERNKREVMALSARDRRRIKSVKDGALDDPIIPVSVSEENAYRSAMSAIPLTGATATMTAPGPNLSSNKTTNYDLEIRRRFALPLGAETLEFPAREHIQARIEPICYEVGLGGGVATGSLAACSDLLETAAEMFVKELVTAWFGATRVNGNDELVQTAKYKRILRREERAVEKGELQRNALGLLPVEADATARRQPLGIEDVVLALRLDGGRLRGDQFLAETIMADGGVVDADEEMVGSGNGNGVLDGAGLPVLELGVNGGGKREREGTQALDALAMEMDVDEESWSWQGGAGADRMALMDVLGGALAVGS